MAWLKLKKLLVFLCLSFLLLGCIGPQQPSANAEEQLQSEALEINSDLDDLSDLQSILNDAAVLESGIDANSLSE